MDWGRLGRDWLAMERDALRLLREEPGLNPRYFAALEARYTQWLEEMRAAGVVAPGMALLGVLWLAGLASARLLPARWQALLTLLAAAWLVRLALIAPGDEAAEPAAATKAGSDDA